LSNLVEEEDIDDLEYEFDHGMDPEHAAEAALSSRLNTGRGGLDSAPPGSQIPLLTYCDEVRNPNCLFSLTMLLLR